MMGLDRRARTSSLDCARAIVEGGRRVARFMERRAGARVMRVFFEVGLQFALFGEVQRSSSMGR